MAREKINENTLNFISDWKNRTQKQQVKNIVILVCSLLVAFTLCSIFFFRFQEENYERIVAHNGKYVQDSALQDTEQIESKLEDAVKQIQNFSSQYSVLSNNLKSYTIEEKLMLVADKAIFDRIGFVLPDGTDTTLEGKSNIYDRAYFQDGLKGNSGYEYIEKSRVTGKSCMVFYAPVLENKKITGVMIGFYEMERMEKLFSYEFFNFKPESYLVKKDGTVVAGSEDKIIKENIFDRLSKKKFSEDVDYSDIQAAIENPERTSLSFSFVDGKETSVGVITQFEGNDWMVLSLLPYGVTEKMVRNANGVGITLMVTIILTFSVIIGLLVLTLKSQNRKMDKEMTMATDNLKLSVEHDQKQSFIIESLGNAYSSVYNIDVASGDYERITEREVTVQHIPSIGRWETAYTGYMNDFVDDSFREELSTFLHIETVIDDLSKNENENLTVEYQRLDKGWRRAVMLPAEYNAQGQIKSVIYAVQKIDNEKKRERDTKLALQDAYNAAQLASEAKTTFLSNMSHDIRTPMNAIIGMTAIAAANIDNTDKVSDCLGKITASSKHLLGLINEVLDMSKIESGKVDLNEEEFSLSTLLDDLITINQPLIKQKHHTLVVKTNNLEHENVIGDRTRLQQVFTNLLTNAIKYTPDSGLLEIVISEKKTNKSTVGWFEVVFKDNGIGMSEEFQKNLFEPFSRAKDHRITGIQGTGLGMPIARNIVRMMNGDITLESKIDEGSKFTVSFALRLQRDEEENYDSFLNLPVLVVDDDVEACESACVMLNSLSMSSEWVTSGREAVEKTVKRHEQNDDYYAIIIDWRMPEMNGVETTRAIRQKIGNDVPIIVLSAYDWSDIEQEAKEAGANAFLSKPLFKSKIVSLFSDLTGREKKPESSTVEEIESHSFANKRILLAEDNELNREIAVELLSMMDIQIDTVENGEECVKTFTSAPKGYYDLILMDIQMPVMTGYEAASAIRASKHPDAGTVPILAMTANAFSTDVRAAFDAGMNGHLSKPIDIDIIIKTLEEHLG